MKNTKGCIRVISALLSVLMVLSMVSVGILADNDTSSTQQTEAPSTTTAPSPETTTPSTDTSANTESSSVTTEPIAPPEIISANLDLGNYKRDYFAGENFDPSGIFVVLSYIGLPSERVELATFGNYSPTTLKAGDTAVTVKVNEIFSFDIPVNVSNIEVTSVAIDVSDPNIKLKYLQGEKFDPTGIKLTVKYNNGETETITDTSKFTIHPSGALNNENMVVISYGGKNIPIRISVSPVTSITVESLTSPIVFGQYQIFDRSKIKVLASYANGESRIVDDYTVEDGGFEATGDGSINIKYYSASASVNVSVVELTGIRVTKRPTKLSYNEGEFLISEGLEVSGVYIVDGNTVEYPIGGYTVNSQKLLPDADKLCEITVNFKEMFTDNFTVNVSPIVQLNITALPTKLNYYEGEAFDMTGMIVQAVFDNGSKLDNFTDYTIPEESLYINSAYMPYVQYGEIKAIITVNVIAIQGIGVTKNPDRILYTEEEIFDPTGIEITAYYSDGTYNLVEPGACVFPTEPLKIYDTTVTIKYKDFSYTIDIIVSDKIYAKSLDAVSLPNTSFVSGQELSLEGIKLVLSLSNGQTQVLELSEVTVSPEIGSPLFSGIDNEVVITYIFDEDQEVTCTIPISVSDKAVSALFITKYPDKMVYSEGETFDPTGMIVKAYYNDNSTEEVTNYSITSTPFIISSAYAEKVRVYLSVGSTEQSFEVTVNPTIISLISVTTPPNKVSYDPGDMFDPTGMIVKVTYANGKSVVIPDNMYKIASEQPFKAGDSLVTIEFRGKTTALSVSVSGEVTTPEDSDTQPPSQTTTPPEVTTPDEPDVTTTKEDVTTTTPAAPDTTDGGNSGVGGIKIIFICLVFFIVALVVLLIIYYRRHFC